MCKNIRIVDLPPLPGNEQGDSFSTARDHSLSNFKDPDGAGTRLIAQKSSRQANQMADFSFWCIKN
jgi:hypothetical protein